MLRLACLTALLLLTLPGVRAQAQAPSGTPSAPPPATAAPAADAPADAGAPRSSGTPEPAVRRTQVEDDNARIEELRVRGQVKRIAVQPKKGGKAYEVLPMDATRDTSQEGARGAGGQSVWHFLSF